MTEEPAMPAPFEPGQTLILVRRAKAGDDDAFTEIYRQHAHRVTRSVALRLVGQGVHEMEDVVQETFMYAFEGIRSGKFDEGHSDGGFRNWLATIAVNKIRDRARVKNAQKRGAGKVKLMRDVFASDVGDPGLASPLARPSQILRGREFEAKLSEALEKLDARHRAIIDLRDHCEMSYDEIAAEMGYKKAATMRSLYKRAKVRLREHLAALGIEAT